MRRDSRRFFVTAEEFAQAFGFDEKTVLRLCDQGLVRTQRNRGAWMIEIGASVASIERFKETSRQIAEKYGGELDIYER